MPSLFSYSTAPQPIKPVTKYRNKDATGDLSLSLMSDPRVVRGTTATPMFATRAGGNGAAAMGDDAAAGAVAGAEGTHARRKVAASSSSKEGSNQRGAYTFEFKKYSNDDLDLTLYLTEQNDKKNRFPPKVVETQTDAFVPRPQTPDYIPRKTGIDSFTQVENGNELFDFDVEVAPMLDVIVAKTLEQALFEVNAESELFELNETMGQFVAMMEEEKRWVDEREEETRRQMQQKEEDVFKMRNRADALLQTTLKVAGVQMMDQVMPALFDEMTEDFYKSGDWNDMLRKTAEQAVTELTERYALAADGCLAAEEVIDEILQSAQETFANMPEYAPTPRILRLTIILRKDSGGDGAGGGEGEGGEGGGGDDAEAPIETELVVEGLPGDDDVPAGVVADADEPVAPPEPEIEPGATKIGPLVVDEVDDIRSVQKRLDEALKAAGKGDAKIDLYPYFVAALRGRDFPRDASLLNFQLPSTLNIVI